MSLTPLLQAGPIVVLHTGAALIAFLIGLMQIFGPKDTTAHRLFGWSWVLLLGTAALSSFWIHGLRLIGRFSPIHLLSILVLILLPLGVIYARRHRVSGHKKTMGGIFFGALVVAGLLTFLPGRVMHAVLFGG